MANLHIKVPSSGDNQTDETYFKIEDNIEFGNGSTEIGRLGGNGPVIIQKAGSMNYNNSGPRLTIKQVANNGTTGLSISTYTTTSGEVDKSDIFSESGDLYVRAFNNLNFRTENGSINFATNGANQRMEINEYGQVGIGTTTHIDNFTKLTVAGRIHAQEVKVTAGAGADFVFDKDYNLPGITETEDFIKANQHLPGIPSAEEMQQNGINLGEMQIKLLQKIEELTLYVIELKKENEEMKEEIENLKNN
jgi:hypothetical protein